MREHVSVFQTIAQELKFVWRCVSCTTFASGASLPGMLKPTRVGLCGMAGMAVVGAKVFRV